MRRFGRYIGIDYCGAETMNPNQRKLMGLESETTGQRIRLAILLGFVAPNGRGGSAPNRP